MISFLALLAASSISVTPIASTVNSIKYDKNNINRKEQIDLQTIGGSVSKSLKTTKGIYSDISDNSKFSIKANDWYFFTKLDTNEKIGYSDLDPISSYLQNRDMNPSSPNYLRLNSILSLDESGLCEYVSLTMLYTYFQLYRSRDFYSQSKIKKYFRNGILDKNHFEHNQNIYENNIRAGVAYNIYKNNGKIVNLFFGSELRSATKNFVGKVTDDYSVSYMHTSQPEDWIKNYHVPVILVSGNFSHSILIYGYNPKTKEYAIHYGFEGRQMEIIKKSDIWSFGSLGYWYGIR